MSVNLAAFEHVYQEKEAELRARQASSLKKKLARLAHRGAKGDHTTLFGLTLPTHEYIRVSLGPIVGKVTSTTANVMLEINNEAAVIIYFVPASSHSGAKVVSESKILPRNRPEVFEVTGLKPDTLYNVCFAGLSTKAVINRTAQVRTFPEKITKLSVLVVSCDRPERLLDDETNLWRLVEEKEKSGEVQITLHLGDQVYAQKELIDGFVILRQAKQDGVAEGEQLLAVYERVQNRLGDIYRFNWNLPRTAQALAHGSHLMIWSDNDLYNDFTIAKGEKGQGLSPIMIHLGHQVYRRYQRQLWDADCEINPMVSSAEESFHKYGPVGILLIDMRGNRIDIEGNQKPDNLIVSDTQWELINSAFADPEVKVMLVCSEIPFVGDTPEVAKKNSTKADLEFLKDHWVYSDHELVKLLEKCFDWKAQGEREVVMLAGDIHVGVDSVINDAKTGLSIRHLTATPITNHVCKFFPALEGAVNERFTFKHTPLEKRNIGQVDISTEHGLKVESRLIPDPHPIGH